MALVTGTGLDPKKFFKSGQPSPQGSSFDLSIGSIFDHKGNPVEGPFVIEPNHMVQVVSSEVFDLSDSFTGHVTYKTTLTKKGIWALTVGIVDPGWDGPVATTLLNFSKVPYAITNGDAFLRVSLFEHPPVPKSSMRKAPPLEDYLKDIRKAAATMFPSTFLNSGAIATAAGRKVLKQIRIEALAWVVLIVAIFTIAQMTAGWFTRWSAPTVTKEDINLLQTKLDVMQERLLKFEQEKALAQAKAEAKSQEEANSKKSAQPVDPGAPNSANEKK